MRTLNVQSLAKLVLGCVERVDLDLKTVVFEASLMRAVES